MEKETFKFKYKFSENYNPVYVNGAYGGVSHKGEIVINFFFERIAIPNSVTHAIEGQKLGKEIKVEPEDHGSTFLRYVTSGIIVNLEEAKSIHNWLGNKIKKLENEIKSQEGTSKKEKKK